jgi:Ca2+-binding EF-hand superfamily protein
MTLSGIASASSMATGNVAGCTPSAARPDGGPRVGDNPVERVFNVVDANRDGSIDTLDLSDLFQKAKAAGVDPGIDADAVMKALDSNGDTAISRDEFQQAAEALRKTVQDMGPHRTHGRGREIRELFNRLDANHDGGIDSTEMDAELSRLAESRGSSDGLPTSAEVMQALDRNGDGSISARELRKALRHHHHEQVSTTPATTPPATTTPAATTPATTTEPTGTTAPPATTPGDPTSSAGTPPATEPSTGTPTAQLTYVQTTTFSFSMQVVVQRYMSVSVAGQNQSAPSLNAQA